MLPQWINKYLSEDEFKNIEALITEIETKTDGEVLPVITQQSQDYKNFSFFVSLSLMAITMPIYAFLNQKHIISHFGFWILSISTLLLALLILPQLINSSCLASLLSKIVPNNNLLYQKALLEFTNNQVGKTHFKTGVLIFISLFEKQVVVLADKAINDKVDSNQWSKTVDSITKGIRDKNLFQGLKNGLEECSLILEKEFPHTTAQPNQLPDRLIVLKKF